MTERIDHSGEGPVLDQAIARFVRTRAEDSGEADWIELAAWLEASPSHIAAFERIERLWAELDDRAFELAQWTAGKAPAVVVALDSRRPRDPRVSRPSRRWLARASAAAGVVLAVGGAWWVQDQGPEPRVFATGKGETRSILLADGSRIQLNSGSRIEVRVSRTRRRVSLASGEAAFDIAKDPAHPFVVAVGDRRVKVVGTEFNILRHAGAIQVTVRRGVVEVAPPASRSGRGHVRLTPGQQLAHREGSDDARVQTVAADEAFAWRQGYVVYRGRALPEVAVDLNRYFARPIRVEGSARRLTFSGALQLDDEEAVIRRLEAFLPVRADRSPAQITLRSRSSLD